jgi:hypothetical protein
MLATGLYYSFCAGSGLLDAAKMTTLENVKLEGRWYQPLSADAFGMNDQSVIVYRALDTDRIELVKLQNADGSIWLFRSYNLRYSKHLDRKIPRGIDVFDIREGLASKQYVAQFQYEDIRNAIGADNPRDRQ